MREYKKTICPLDCPDACGLLIEIGDDGLIYIDTGTTEEGPAPGVETIDEPPTGPSCAEESH